MFPDEMIPNALRQVEPETGFPLLDGRPLIIGVSGGPDSLALLHALATHHSPLSTLVAAHLNHNLRPSAANDARFVAATAKRWKVKAIIGDTDVAALAKEQNLSIEEAGRKARYAFLAQVARKENATAVLVAHNADDQVETILMHILRGSGLAGLRGMPLIGPLPGSPDLLLVRPFLTIERATIEAYCRAWQLEPLQDETNQDTTFFRNRLRHELLPLLAEYSPQIKQRLRQLSAVVAADYQLLEEITERAWSETVLDQGETWVQFDRQKWADQPLSTRRSLLRRAFSHCRPQARDVDFEAIEQARQVAEKGETGAQSALPAGVVLRIDYQRLTVTADPHSLPSDIPQLPGDEPIPLPVPGEVKLPGDWLLTAEPISTPDLAAIYQNRDPWQAFISLPDGETLLIRPRQPGERFQPLGMDGHTAAVKEVMVNRKIPAAARPRWPIVTTHSHLVWLAGHVIDGRAAVTNNTQTAVHLRLIPLTP